MKGERIRHLAIFLGAATLSYALTASFEISLTFSSASTLMSLISQKRLMKKRSWELLNALPEIIDYVISGIQSGLSLNESLSALGSRGPMVSRTFFSDFEESMKLGETFEDAISTTQSQFALRAADQLFEALLFAKVLGGAELVTLLRQLGDFTRQDLALRKEIAAKQSWIRNSAHLSAAAPWILLILLSMQPSTAEAFSSPAGLSILLSGVALTAIAYTWMGRLGNLPEPRRIFGSQ
jgi:tight adherence protein B